MAERWWEKERQKLIDIAKRRGSVYVYNLEEIQMNIQQMVQIEAVDRFFYAMKANSHPQILQHIYKAGLGFECVSIGEVEWIIKLFPDIDRNRILFTPNFAPRSEYIKGFNYNINVTLDNLYPLQKWAEVFRNRDLFLRIDPGHGRGHHKYVKTGGNHSKFGIPRSEIGEVLSCVNKVDAHIKGLHAHIGSGIKNEKLWKSTALILHEVSQQLGGVKILNLGGGFGVAEHESEASVAVPKVNQSLKTFKANHPEYELWIEPGRFLVATAGILLTRVNQLKGKSDVRYIGVDTGMNSLIRPALYGARHTIKNLSKLHQPDCQIVNIVGPICESGDKLGMDRCFPETKEGDIICIANTGAYGHVMSSNYNMRSPAEEVILEMHR